MEANRRGLGNGDWGTGLLSGGDWGLEIGRWQTVPGTWAVPGTSITKAIMAELVVLNASHTLLGQNLQTDPVGFQNLRGLLDRSAAAEGGIRTGDACGAATAGCLIGGAVREQPLQFNLLSTAKHLTANSNLWHYLEVPL